MGCFLVLDGAVSYLFYRSWLGFILLFPAALPYMKLTHQKSIEKRKREFSGQFLTGMQAVSTNLWAGSSMEQAFTQALGELKKIYPPKADILWEFQKIQRGLGMNVPLETLLEDLAWRTQIDDVENFAQVFRAARRSGGDMLAVIGNTLSAIRQKEETMGMIQVCIASKKLEHNVMSVVPFFILAYVGISSPGFLDVMYHNPRGIIIMTICLAIYVTAWMLGRKIVDIEV